MLVARSSAAIPGASPSRQPAQQPLQRRLERPRRQGPAPARQAAEAILYPVDFLCFLGDAGGCTRTCTRTRIPVNCHPSLRRAASRSGVRWRTMAAIAPRIAAKRQFACLPHRQRERGRQAGAAGAAGRARSARLRGDDGRPSRPRRRRRQGCGRAVAGSVPWRTGGSNPISGAAVQVRRAPVGGYAFEHHSGLRRHGARADAHARLAPLRVRQLRHPRRLHRLHARSSISSRCATRRRSSIRGCRRSSSPTSARRRCKTQELVQGHLNAMAIRLGELQAQMLRLDGLGERLAKHRRTEAAGAAVAALGRGARAAAARSRRCRRGRCRCRSSPT